MSFQRLRVCVLGRLEIWHDEQRVELPASKKTRALLAYLVVSGRSHTRQRLCDLLWDGPDDPRAALRWSLWKLRPLVDHPRTQRLVATRDAVAFEHHGAEVDLAQLRGAISGGIQNVQTQSLADAAGLLRGELLEGLELDDCFRFHQWCVGQREELRVTQVAVHAALVNRYAQQPELALRHARALLELDPLLEAAHVTVIELLERLGRFGDALDQYEACKAILQREVHVPPSVALTRLYGRLARPMGSVAPAVKSKVITEPATAQPPLVGRSVELEAIERTLAATLRGCGPGMLLFTGDPGIGKTRLLDAVAERASGAGARVLRARAYEAEQRRPYGPWLDALALAEVAIPAQSQDRPAFWTNITGQLNRLAEQRPLIIIVDDVQWLDEESAAFLHHAVRTSANQRFMIAAGARSGELADNLPCLRVMRALSRTRRLETVTLGPLTDEASIALARFAGPAINDLPRIARESQGNPLFVLELSRGPQTAIGRVPSSLEELIRDRLDQLDPDARQILPWIAAFGHDAPADVLTEVTGLGSAALALSLEKLERRNVLRARGDNWDFAHDLVRTVAYEGLSAPRRKTLHLLLARTLSQFTDLGDARAGDVARHAALGGDAALCASACVRAGERCLRLFAYRTAESLSELGRNMAARLPHARRIPLQIGLLGLVVHPGARLRARDELGHELVGLVNDAANAALPGERARALVLLARLYYHGFSDTPRARAALAQAVALLEKDPAANVEALISSVRCLALLHADMPRVRSLFESLALLGDRVVDSLYYCWGIGLVHRWAGDIFLARQALRSAAAHARGRADHWAEFECGAAQVMLELEAHEDASAQVLSAVLLEVAGRLGQDGSEYAFAKALAALAQDDVEALARARADLDRLDAPALAAYVGSNAAMRSVARGANDVARAFVDHALKNAERSTQPVEIARARATLGAVLRACGQAQDAEAASHLRACLARICRPTFVLSSRKCQEIRCYADHDR